MNNVQNNQLVEQLRESLKVNLIIIFITLLLVYFNNKKYYVILFYSNEI